MKTLVKTTPRKLSPWRPTLTSLGPLWHQSTPAGQWGQHKIIIIISVHINNDFKQNTKMWTIEKVHSFRTKIFFYLKKQSMINIRQVDPRSLILVCCLNSCQHFSALIFVDMLMWWRRLYRWLQREEEILVFMCILGFIRGGGGDFEVPVMVVVSEEFGVNMYPKLVKGWRWLTWAGRGACDS